MGGRQRDRGMQQEQPRSPLSELGRRRQTSEDDLRWRRECENSGKGRHTVVGTSRGERREARAAEEREARCSRCRHSDRPRQENLMLSPQERQLHLQ